MFHYTAPEDVACEMGELIAWYRTEGQNLHPAVTAALLHYRFVRIHPFDDGNGRLSRLLLNYHLLRKNLPPVVIKSQDKRNYLFALQKADTGEMEAFCLYVAEQLLWSLDLAIKAAKGESVEEKGDWRKRIQLQEKSISKDKNVQEISNDILFQRFTDSVLPLIKYCSEGLSSVDRLFAKVNSKIDLRLSGQYFQCPPNDPYKKVKELYEAKKLDIIREVQWGVNWSGLLANPEVVNNISAGLTIYFEQFIYKVDFIGKTVLSKPYSTGISLSEQEEVVEKIGKVVADRLDLILTK